MEKTLLGKVALVTGGSRGIGAAIAKQFAEAGARVAITYSASADQAQDVVNQIETLGAMAIAIQADASQRGSGSAAVDHTVERFGGLDILAANAGVFEMVPIDSLDDAAYQHMFDVNVRAVVEIVQTAAAVISSGGRIILTGSINADSLFAPGIGLYGATKAAVGALGKGWARELGPRGVTVNVIQPGPIDTDMNPADSEFAAELRASMPLGRYGRPEEVAALAAFLASEEAAFITGARINIDGGLTV